MFFFSSRRRHTRLQGDWSSDVCSSDLDRANAAVNPPADSASCGSDGRRGPLLELARIGVEAADAIRQLRSEERRVGKDCDNVWMANIVIDISREARSMGARCQTRLDM